MTKYAHITEQSLENFLSNPREEDYEHRIAIDCLRHLREKDKAITSDLFESVKCADKHRVMKLLNRLERGNYVVKSQSNARYNFAPLGIDCDVTATYNHNGRANLYSLTEKGRKFAERIPSKFDFE